MAFGTLHEVVHSSGAGRPRQWRHAAGSCLPKTEIQVDHSVGHAVGDLLQELARHTGYCVYESDTAGRIGADEFMVLLNRIRWPEHATCIVEKIRAALDRLFDLPGYSLQIASSWGIADSPASMATKRSR